MIKPTRKRARTPSTAAAPEAAAAHGTAGGGFPIVGIGASAGGLEAVVQFLGAMPVDSGMGFVLVQHLDPSHPSILTEILQRATAMPVVEAADQMVVEPNRVHVIPPNRDLGIFHGVLQLSMPAEPRGLRMPIDAFMRSLAEDRAEDAVGIVLSGTGTDGTLGLRAIFGAGGLCLVQDPDSARFGGMPDSVIHAGYASQVLPPDQMPQALIERVRALPSRGAAVVPSTSGLAKVLMLLRSVTGHDFTQYKRSTIGRRIERRMAQNGIDDIEVYVRFLRERPAELQTLFREMLINVTSFFRDPAAFDALKTQVLPALLADKPAGYVLRVWVAGCATGEEAYSIAMLLRELIDETHHDLNVQLYATDLDDEAIATARAGLYPLNIAQDVSPERLRRFFREEEHGYRVRKEVRDMVVFAVQSVIKDPPFTRLDLLSCRNLMIYLEPELQERLLPAFHYALKPDGLLFLSPSESIGSHAELFEVVDRKWKIFRARRSIVSTRVLLGSGQPWVAGTGTHLPSDAPPRTRDLQVGELARRVLLQSFAPAAVVTDGRGVMLYVNGETGRYLRPAPGLPTHNVVDMARDGLQLELREALRQVADQGRATVNRLVTVVHQGEVQQVSLSVRPLVESEAGAGLLLVTFQEPAPASAAPAVRRTRPRRSAESQRVEALERELTSAKETLTALLEEQQASNEELKSANEELQSTNEELQSTNEELETSKEELQSVNEEMMTVNAELQSKIEQMADMQDDMKNLLDNVRVGTIFLDRQLRIRRFTRDATRVYRLQPTDVGRRLSDIRSELQDADLLGGAQAVLDSLVPMEREVCTAGGIWYLARIQPYRTVEDVIDGVVLTFADVTERVHAIAARKAREIAEAIVDTVRDPLLVLDADQRVQSANRAYHRAFGSEAQATVGRVIYELDDGRWDLPPLRAMLGTPSSTGGHEAVARIRDDGGTRPVRFRAARIAGQEVGSDELIMLAIEFLDPAEAGPP